ncbi:hypothetical protein N9195_03270, partial [bacterium]|nr:hypothetical protein [bacterium]
MKLFLLLIFPLFALQGAPVKIAIIGDSISFGSGAKPISTNRYSTKLGVLLGKDYLVETFAASSLCILRNADRPFLKTPHFKKALDFKPDVAVITLGTN